MIIEGSIVKDKAEYIYCSGFIAVCPEGVMNRENILDMYAMPRHRAKLFANQIFKLFDKDGTGIINFRVKTI